MVLPTGTRSCQAASGCWTGSQHSCSRTLDPRKPQGNNVTASRDNTDRAPEDAPKPALGTFLPSPPAAYSVLAQKRHHSDLTKQSDVAHYAKKSKAEFSFITQKTGSKWTKEQSGNNMAGALLSAAGFGLSPCPKQHTVSERSCLSPTRPPCGTGALPRQGGHSGPPATARAREQGCVSQFRLQGRKLPETT